MFVVLAWFAADHKAARRLQSGITRANHSIAALLPETCAGRDIGGSDWGITVWHHDPRPYRWPTLAEDGDITAISLGIPVGAAHASGPLKMARQLLDGIDVHADIVPPFGLIACEPHAGRAGTEPDVPGDGTARVAIQQDWLGHCRLFTATAGGVTAFCTRPSPLAALLTGSARPSPEGWEAYAVAGQFSASTSPIDGVRQLHPGERFTCSRSPGGGWSVASEIRFAVDDVISAGLAARGAGLESTLDMAAAAFRGTIASLDDLNDDEITLGLSGGKDSRLMAAVFFAAGRLPNLFTNDDTKAEGEVARRLVEIIGQTRGVHPHHKIGPAAAAQSVLDVGLAERARRLQRHFDFQYPSTYLARPAVSPQLPAAHGPLSISGVAGELATGYWYPVDHDTPDEATRAQAIDRLLTASGPDVASPAALQRQRLRVTALLDHAAELGLDAHEQADYLFLMERVRRWATSAYRVGTVVPFLTPDVLAATFALTAAQKRARELHSGLIRRFVPEWVDVPYVLVSTGPSRATRVWEGDGLATVRRLLDHTSTRGIAGLLQTEAVRKAVDASARGSRSAVHRRAIEQYVALAVASKTLEPAVARPTFAMSMRNARSTGRRRARRLAGKVARRIRQRYAKPR